MVDYLYRDTEPQALGVQESQSGSTSKILTLSHLFRARSQLRTAHVSTDNARNHVWEATELPFDVLGLISRATNDPKVLARW